jgi:hypothetical protein
MPYLNDPFGRDVLDASVCLKREGIGDWLRQLPTVAMRRLMTARSESL